MNPGFSLAAGGLGLFLLGMVVMTRGLKSLAGGALRRALARFTKSPLSGAVTGAIATAIIQSSSATTVTAVGFVGAGLLTFSQALGIIFGANIGTTVTGWFVAILGFKLQVGQVALPLILVGVLIHLFAKRTASAIGLAIAGFGLIFVGIETLQQGMAGLEGFVTPESFPSDTLTGRLLLILIGVGITLVTQSSSAGVATALAAVNAGAISFPQAAAMVIGMDVGTTVTAAMATIGGNTDARRTGFAHVIYNVLTGMGAFCLLTPYAWACERYAPGFIERNPEIALVGFHTLFNTLGVIVILPLTGAFAAMIVRLVPERPVRYTQRLDASLYESPPIAIEAVRATLIDIAKVVFLHLERVLDEDDDEELDTETLSEANEALKQARDYLEPIDTSLDHGMLYPKHLAAIHTIDHLRRLIDRCEEVDRARRLTGEPEIDSLTAALRTGIQQASSTFDDANDIVEEKTKSVWQEFDGRAERYRNSLIKGAADGEFDAYAAIGRLDTVRWLRRVSYHVWRIVHHLQRAQIDIPIGSVEDVPAHQEQSFVD